MKKISILLFIFIIPVLIVGFNTRAQEEASLSITADDLGVSEPKILPNSPFYFLKNFQRQLRLAFAFNPVKKAELRLQFANEMLVEAQKLAEKTGNQELFQRAVDKYQKQIEKIQNQVESCGFKIDFVISNANTGKRIAIECDGPCHFKDEIDEMYGIHVESDEERQRVLEAAGWKFCRIKYADWLNEKFDRKTVVETIKELLN